MHFIYKIPIEIWISILGTLIAAVLTGVISVFIAIYTLNKQSKEEKRKEKSLKNINQATVIDLMDYALSSLLYLSLFSNEDIMDDKILSVGIKKIYSVNIELDKIKATEVPEKFRAEYQSCKIILKILEIEIASLLENTIEHTTINIKNIDIERRIDKISKIVELYKV